MASSEDVARELHRLGEATARKIDQEPTGVEPGYNFAVGAAILPNGRLRYAGASSRIAIYELSSDTTRTASFFGRINFDSPIVAGVGVTTGASWAFAPPAEGVYRFSVSTKIEPSAALASGENLYLQLWPNAGGTGIIDLDWFEVMATETNPRSQVILQGEVERYCLTSDAIHIRFGNGTGNSVSQVGSATQNYATRISIERLS